MRPSSACISPLLAVVMLTPHAGCNRSVSPESDMRKDKNRIRIVCTTTMIEDLARRLVGDTAEVYGVMRAGEDPHTYNVRPRDGEKIATADLVLTNGYHLEATLDKVIQNNASGRVVALAELAVTQPLGSLDEDEATAPDPHCWMSVNHFRGYVQHARDALTAVDPANAALYRERAGEYDRELQALDAWIRTELSSIPENQRVIVTSHDAFQYLAQAYGLDVRAMIGISTAEAPRPREIEKIEALINDRGVKALFIETSTSATLNTLVKKSAAATGARIGGTLYSDSLDEPGKPAGSYIGMMRHNVSTIADSLKHTPPANQEGATAP